MEMRGGMNTTSTLEGRGRVTRCLSVDTTLAVSSPASGTVWQNDSAGRGVYTEHSLFICTHQLPVAHCEPQICLFIRPFLITKHET